MPVHGRRHWTVHRLPPYARTARSTGVIRAAGRPCNQAAVAPRTHALASQVRAPGAERLERVKAAKRRRRTEALTCGDNPAESPPGVFARQRDNSRLLEHRVGLFAEINRLGYPDVMYATAVVEGKVIRFKLSPALARAHRENRGKTMTDQEAVAFVERKRRARALRRARPYLESRS